MKINDRMIEVSNTNKILFGKDRFTKGDVIDYYKNISSVMVFHLKNRPLTLHRFPDGIDEDGFYQKEIPNYFPDWMDRVTVEKREGGNITHALCNNPETLVYLANQACITHHIWLSTVSDLEKPDKMIFDLDPPDGNFTYIVKAALAIKKLFDTAGMDSYLMTTGSRGVHIAVPIIPEMKFDEVRSLAKKAAEHIAKENPQEFTTELRKENRKNRVFIDYLRNAYGQTSVAPYSIRSIEGAPVAAPLDWDELGKEFHPRKYSIKNIFRRLGQKEDPWKDIYSRPSSLHLMKDLFSLDHGE